MKLLFKGMIWPSCAVKRFFISKFALVRGEDASVLRLLDSAFFFFLVRGGLNALDCEEK